MEVTVRGAGVFGLAIGYACARRGARVRVIDPYGVAAAASGGLVGALAPHVPDGWNAKKAFQFESLLMAGAFWAGVGDLSGLTTGYGRMGRVQPVGDPAVAGMRAAAAAQVWRGLAEWRVEPAGDWGPVAPGGMVVADTLSARINPVLACAALAGALRALGGEVVPDGAEQGPVIWATGAGGLADLSRWFGVPVGVAEKGQALALRFAAAGQPQVLVDGLHIVPHDDGTVAVGSTSERVFGDPAATDGVLDGLLARAVAAMPVLAGAPVVARWAGLRPRSVTRAPVLGAWPGRAGHFVANGGFKIGFGMAPKVAEVMADLVLEGRDGVPAGFGVADCLARAGSGKV